MRHRMMLAVLVAVLGTSAARADGCTNCAPAAAAPVGCTDCGPTLKHSIASRGTLATDLKFAFGSTKSFFSPCGVGVGYGHGRKSPCSLPVYGSGIGEPANSCRGPFTHMNR